MITQSMPGKYMLTPVFRARGDQLPGQLQGGEGNANPAHPDISHAHPDPCQHPKPIPGSSLCSTRSVGDERHYLFECPKFDEIRAQFAELYESSAGAMRSFVWHKDQQAVCDCMTAVMHLAET